MCEWEAPPPQMHRVFLHLLFLSVVFFERCIGRLCICVFLCHLGALGVFAYVVFLLFFVFFLCFFFVVFLEAMWQWEEATLKKKGWRGVGGRAQRLPPRCMGRLCMCCFFLSFLSSSSCVFSSWCSWKHWGSERRQPLKKRLEGGWGEGAAPPPQMLWVSLHVLFFFCHFCLLLVFFLRDVLGSNVAATLKQKKYSWETSFFSVFFLFSFIFFVMCEWEAPPPQMHRVFLHLLFLSVVFFERCIGRLCICVFLCHLGALGVFAYVVFLLFFVFFLCFFFVMFLEAMWQWEEATFEKKGWRGVGGEGAAPPPRCMGCLCMCCFLSVIFVFFFLCFFFVMFLEALWQWEEATFEKKGWRGVGGRAQRLPPRCFGCLCICCFFSVIVVFFLCFFFVMFLEAMWQWEEATFKKKAGGGCIGRLCMCCFLGLIFVFFLCSWCSWKQCGSERRQPFSFHVFFCDGAGLPGIFCISFHGRSRHSRVVEVRWRTLAVYDRGWRPENYTSIDPR